MAASEPAGESDHAEVSRRFTDVVEAVRDWDAPTPVKEWAARDVVAHLTTWFPEFLVAGGIHGLPTGVRDDPVGSWRAQVSRIEELLTRRGAEPCSHPYVGTHTVSEVVARFYTPDVFMHTWDLARAAGVDDRLDATRCAGLLEGMTASRDMIRGSGQFGDELPVADDADVQTRLFAFIGRDTMWCRPDR